MLRMNSALVIGIHEGSYLYKELVWPRQVQRRALIQAYLSVDRPKLSTRCNGRGWQNANWSNPRGQVQIVKYSITSV